jgi:hypothetical protein
MMMNVEEQETGSSNNKFKVLSYATFFSILSKAFFDHRNFENDFFVVM